MKWKTSLGKKFETLKSIGEALLKSYGGVNITLMLS